LADMLAIRCETPQDHAMVHGMAAALLQREGELRQAETEYLAAARAWEVANLGESAYAGAIYASLASLYVQQRRNDDARRSLARALDIFDRAEGTLPMDRIRTLYLSGALHARLGEWTEAERDLSRALAFAAGEQRMDGFSLRVLLTEYAQALRGNGHRREARSIDARTATLPSTPSSAAIVDMTDFGSGVRRRSN
jgi:tetratricopeptide (TPR) repeat protein